MVHLLRLPLWLLSNETENGAKIKPKENRNFRNMEKFRCKYFRVFSCIVLFCFQRILYGWYTPAPFPMCVCVCLECGKLLWPGERETSNESGKLRFPSGLQVELKIKYQFLVHGAGPLLFPPLLPPDWLQHFK